MKFLSVAVLLMGTAVLRANDPPEPKLVVPAEVRPANGYVRFSPETDAVSVTYVAIDGLYPFPNEELKDRRRFVLPTAGVAPGAYRFTAVASGKAGGAAVAEFTVVIPDALANKTKGAKAPAKAEEKVEVTPLTTTFSLPSYSAPLPYFLPQNQFYSLPQAGGGNCPPGTICLPPRR